jgi:hypothetical protein
MSLSRGEKAAEFNDNGLGVITMTSLTLSLYGGMYRIVKEGRERMAGNSIMSGRNEDELSLAALKYKYSRQSVSDGRDHLN